MNKLKYVVYYVYRSAINGKYVSAEFAKKHPDTTIKEKRERYTSMTYKERYGGTS